MAATKAISSMDAEAEAKRLRKEAKKAKRREREEQEQNAAAEAEPAVDNDDEEEARRKAEKAARKAAKKAAKAAAAAAAEAAETGAAGDQEKSSKKRKRQEDSIETVDTGVHGEAGQVWPYYVQSAAVKAMPAAKIEEFHSSKTIAVEDAHSNTEWRPTLEFAHVGENFTPAVMATTKSFASPSPIQAQCWPIVLSGRDIVGIAATGSGKTLAFTLPAFMHILAVRAAVEGGHKSKKSRSDGKPAPTVLVLAPTRELAMQTAKVSTECGAACDISSVCIYGGVPKEAQRRELAAGGRGADIVVATPGRLLDMVQDGALSLSRVSFLVLDEADRMLDMGFEKDIRAIMALLPAKGAVTSKGIAKAAADNGSWTAPCRQTCMFSATWPPSIQAIASEYLHQPAKVTIGHAELAASKSVTQIVGVVANERDRDSLLLKLLQKYHSTRTNKILVFVLYKKEADRMERFLGAKGWKCCGIHGDMSQEARTRSFNAFREGKIPILVATDVAARGLDIPNVEYVINYSFPLTIEDYVHRIGRTGRGGKTGVSHTMFTPENKGHAGELVNVLREANQTVPDALLKFGTHVKKKEHALYGAHFKAVTSETGAPAAPKKMVFDD